MIRHTKRFLLLAVALLTVSCGSSENLHPSELTARQRTTAVHLLSKMPAGDEAEAQWLYSELIDLGPDGIRAVTGMLVPPGAGNDTHARYAVNGLAKYVSRPGAEAERRMYEGIILEELRSGLAKPVKAFLIRQLELTGSNESVPVLKTFLTDNNLCKPALWTLTAIGTSQAQQAVLQALPKSEGSRRMAIIKALGDMQVAASIQDLIPYAKSDDPVTRRAALYALAHIGDPAAAGVFAQAVETPQSYRQIKALSLYMLFAKRLGEEGYAQQSSEIARNILAGDYPVQAQSAALTILAGNEGAGAQKDLLAAAGEGHPQLRSAALSLALGLPGRAATDAWVAKMQESAPAVQADIAAMLGKSGDDSLRPVLASCLQDSNLQVRLAAIPAVATLGGADVLPDLLEVLHRAEQPEEINAVKTALLQLSAKDLLPAVSQALAATSGPAKIALIQILAERQATNYLDSVLNQLDSSNNAVRGAVYRALEGLATPDDLPRLAALITRTQHEDERRAIANAIVAVTEDLPNSKIRTVTVALSEVLNEAPDSRKPRLLAVLPRIGGEDALNAVIEATKHSNPAVESAATAALAAWGDPTAIPALRSAAGNASPSEQGQIFEGYIRLVGASNYSWKDKIQLLKEAIALADSPQGKARLIQAFSGIHSPDALKAIAGYFNDDSRAVRQQAARSAATLLASQYDPSSSLNSTSGILAVIEATTGTSSRPLAEQIARHIRQIRTRQQESEEFTWLFNGRDLSGWTGATEAYYVKDGTIISRPDGGGNLFTEDQYSDFILRFEFRLTPGANNGLGIRAPLEGDAAYTGMELQILDNTAQKFADLAPYQYHGSIYGVAAAKRGYLRPVGQWNRQEVIARGSRIVVRLNGETIVDADTRKAATPATLDGKEHPGLKRRRGHIGFLGHGAEVAFRNIRIKELNRYLPDYSMSGGSAGSLNQPPEGFRALFNGENLAGWQGLVGNPETRAAMSPEERARAQAKADALMRRHWSVRDGIIWFDGEGSHLCTIEEYGDFELLLDWKIQPGGDSGVYLRGAPQVQIWDVTQWPQGSGGLYNNQQHPADPLRPADNPIGQWNRMRITMIGERVRVHLNGELVVDNVVMENYWNRDIPIYPTGPIELQSHNTPLQFRNIFIREIPRTEPLFNGRDLTGWQRVGGEAGGWHIDDGVLYTEGGGAQWRKGTGGGWLSTTRMYEDFTLALEYRLPEGGNSGVFLRAPHSGDPAFEGLEIQILDDYAAKYDGLKPWQYTGSIYDVQAPSKRVSKPAGQWQKMVIVADGPEIRVTLNGEMIINANLIDYMEQIGQHPGLKRRKGYIGLQNHNSRVEFRNIEITEIN